MKIPVNREHIRKVSEEHGIKVEFDSPTPGVRMPDGKILSWDEVMHEIFSDIGIDFEEFKKEV